MERPFPSVSIINQNGQEWKRFRTKIFFYDRIQKQEITIDQLYDAICRLEIINIRLDMEDNP